MQESKEKKPKKSTRTVDLPVDIRSHAFSAEQLNQLFESESKMAASDKLENERINAKVINAIMFNLVIGYKDVLNK